MPAELVISDQSAERLAAEGPELFFIDLLEELALIEFRCFLQIAQKVLLADVQDLELKHGAGLALIQQVPQAAPGGLQLLKLGLVQYFIELHGKQPVDLSDRKSVV